MTLLIHLKGAGKDGQHSASLGNVMAITFIGHGGSQSVRRKRRRNKPGFGYAELAMLDSNSQPTCERWVLTGPKRGPLMKADNGQADEVLRRMLGKSPQETSAIKARKEAAENRFPAVTKNTFRCDA